MLDKTLSMMMFYSKGKWAGWMLKDAGAALNKSKYLQMSTKTIMLMIFIAHVHIIDNSWIAFSIVDDGGFCATNGIIPISSDEYAEEADCKDWLDGPVFLVVDREPPCSSSQHQVPVCIPECASVQVVHPKVCKWVYQCASPPQSTPHLIPLLSYLTDSTRRYHWHHAT